MRIVLLVSRLSAFRGPITQSTVTRFKNIRSMNKLSNYIFEHSHPALLKVDNQTTLSIRNKSKDRIKEKKKGKSSQILSNEDMSNIIDANELDRQLEAILTSMKEQFTENLVLKSGSNIGNLQVDLSGDVFMVKDLAQISKKPNSLFVLNLDTNPEALIPVKTALSNSGMNLNIQQDGTKLFVQLPRLTREHRERLIKNAKVIQTKTKEEITKLKNSYLKVANSMKNTDGISEDDVFATIESISFKASEIIKKTETILKSKTEELLEE